jgi:hypothetical protein
MNMFNFVPNYKETFHFWVVNWARIVSYWGKYVFMRVMQEMCLGSGVL